MKSTTIVKGTFMPPLDVARLGRLVVLVSAFGPTIAGCIGGWFEDSIPEGDRCNPYDSHNECASGLACTVSSWQVSNAGKVAPSGNLIPALGSGAGPVLMYCAENYCCSVDSMGNINSSNPNCQPGCNGGAATMCTATSDPATCACAAVLDDGGSPTSAACQATPDAGGSAPVEGGMSVEGGGGD
jgi:hypothetical protein